MPTEDEPGIDRRQLLKRAVAVGAVAWTVPAIQTINMTHALANVGSPGDICYTIKFNSDGTCSSASANSNLAQSFGCLWDLDPDIIVTDNSGGCTKATLQKVNGNWNVTLAQGCYLVAGFTKAANQCQPAYTLDGQNANEVDPPASGTIQFRPIGQHAVSHIELTFCCRP
jgi:hypothetical protein